MSGKIEIVKKWIEKGDHDLGTAQITHIHIPKYHDTIAFHCQQAVEKYLKSFLIFLEIGFPRTHNLNFLLSLVAQKQDVSNEYFDSASELEDFAVEIRYPETTIELSELDIQRALIIAKYFRDYVINQMNLTDGVDEGIKS